MKNFTFLVLFLVAICWQGHAQILNQPAGWPNAAWSLTGSYTPGGLISDPTVADANFSFNDDFAGNGNVDNIAAESPVIDLTAANTGGEFWITVEYDYSYELFFDALELQYWDADATAWVTWEALPDNSSATAGWCAEIVAPTVTSSVLDVSGFTATQLSGFQYRFAFDDLGNWTYGYCISSPTITSAAPPPCADPSAIASANITTTSGDVSWTENGTATLWNIEYGPAGFALGTGMTIGGTTNNPENISGLNSGTLYDIYVQADCGTDSSSLIGPFSLNTLFTAPAGVSCGPVFTVAIFSDDMETNTGWTGDIGGFDAQWDFPTADPGGNSTGTGPSGPASGTTFAEFEASGSISATASMITPMIDLTTAITDAELSFYLHAFGADIGTLNVGVGTSQTGPFTTEFSWSGELQTSATDAWEQVGVNLSAYLGQQIYIEFSYDALNSGFEGDLAIDLVEVTTCATCPAPTAFNLNTADLTSAEFGWTESGTATSWELEYGAPGFAPGTGLPSISGNNPETVTGLTSNTFYEIYVQSVCSVGDTSIVTGPILFNTYDLGAFMEWDNECPLGGFVDISSTGVLYDIPDDEEVGIDPLPFEIAFQGTQITSMSVGNNGGLQLGNPNQTNIDYGGDFNTLEDGFMFPWGDDLDDQTDDIFIEQVGTSPNSVLVIQWNNSNNWSNGQGTVTFQVQISEATGEIFFVYDDVIFGGLEAADDYAGNADIGLSGPNQDFTVSSESMDYLMNNSCVRFYYTDCPKPQDYLLSYTTTNEAAISWSSGISNETEWQVIYGQQGFDPTTGGTSVTVNTGSALIIPGLDDMTTYDVYIMALCASGDTSLALTGDFTTLPNCADPTGLAGATAVDSIFTAWNYTANTGFPISEFALEYGPTGYTSGTGTQVYGIDTINTTDTLVDATLMSGGLYDVYVQAVCSPGDTSNWVSIITVTMPLTNDSTCLAQAIPVDAVNYSFNGTGATVATGELAIAPPAGPCDGQMTWCNSSVTASTWYTFVAPASGNVRIDGEFQAFDGQVAVYETSDCNDFNQYNLIGANDDFNTIGDDFIYLNLCGLTPGNTYYMMHDPNGAAGVYSMRLQEIVVEAGTDNGQLDLCLGDTVDLNTQLTGADAGGTWSEDIPTVGFDDPIWISSGLASQVYSFEYMVVDGCAVDSVMTAVEVWSPSFAGNDGTIDACLNEPVDLLQGLVGSINPVDLNGTWYDPSANALAGSNITTTAIPGQYNYQYIAGNGICADDTATVTVIVNPACDFLNLQDLTFNGMDIYPNPTTNVFYIANEGSTEVYDYELTDLNGKVIATKEAAITGVETTEVNVENLETGVYLIRIFNENAEKTFRVVKQ